jgi:hypothetical protein
VGGTLDDRQPFTTRIIFDGHANRNWQGLEGRSDRLRHMSKMLSPRMSGRRLGSRHSFSSSSVAQLLGSIREMPTFAELRAKAEAAANSAKESANSKLADYRGDKKPEKPAYKPPPRRPLVKPPLPLESSRPKPQNAAPASEEAQSYNMGYKVDSPIEDERIIPTQQSPRAQRSVARRESQKGEHGIQTLLQNKELFFGFMDEVRAIL